ncbi:MAG: G1 family endopeptidase [Candidatus Babeliales bacterium]|nr:G1 family endopeptidase [Candidatus Babeliales bacterium]
MNKRFISFLALAIIFTNIFSQVEMDLKNYKYIEPILKPVFRKSKSDGNIKRRLSKPHTCIKKNIGYSTNWSGYAALTNLTNPAMNSVTYISGSWKVPKLSSTKGTSYSAAWVGIDGFVSPTVEQLGTEHDWYGGAQHNYAWYEMYPSASFEFSNFPIHVGDSITATVTYLGNNTFLLALFNNTKKTRTQVSKSSTSAQRSSAEWIMEAPCCTNSGDVLPLSDFNQIKFFNCSCKIKNVTGAINNIKWKNQTLDMVTNNSTLKAVTSGLTNGGKNFSVIWKHA